MAEGEIDEALFRERNAGLRRGLRRSRQRARGLARHLGVLGLATPLITVVGSKGKGTTATAASAELCAAGMRVGTVTSPGLRSNRERIRIDGRAIASADYAALVRQVIEARDGIRTHLADDGYISPNGFFLIAGMLHFLRHGCDAVVLEAGMGGGSDEVAMFEPDVVALTTVLAEHVGVLGDSVTDIAQEKLGVVSGRTRATVSCVQPAADVASLLEGLRHHAYAPAVPDCTPAACHTELSRINVALGCAAGRALLRVHGFAAATARAQAQVLETLSLPGRLSLHRRRAQRWLADCATNPVAVAEALRVARRQCGDIESVLLCVAEGRDGEGIRAALHDVKVVEVKRAGDGTFVRIDDGRPVFEDHHCLGEIVLALGPVYFIRDVLHFVDADTERSFIPLDPSDVTGRSSARAPQSRVRVPALK